MMMAAFVGRCCGSLSKDAQGMHRRRGSCLTECLIMMRELQREFPSCQPSLSSTSIQLTQLIQLNLDLSRGMNRAGPMMFTTWKSLLLVLVPVWIALVGFYLREDVHRNRFIPSSIDLLTLDARGISNLLQNESVTTVQLVEEYLHRIALDNVEGLGLRPILSLISRDLLLREARQLDEERQHGSLRSVLHGVPFLAKVLPCNIVPL
jgi:hypothetical protein